MEAFTRRSHQLKHIGEQELGKEVIICGWIQSIRDHGWILFIDLREDGEIFQIRCDEHLSRENLDLISTIPKETVLQVRWSIELRNEHDINISLRSGTIECVVQEFQILGKCETLPFQVTHQQAPVSEKKRLQRRYLDIRTQEMSESLKCRSEVCQTIRWLLLQKDFTEIQTPLLGIGTDEGAREFLVPSRKIPWWGFALPQSPQQYKQLLMMSWIDKYYQIATCFRDEDGRADRQPEFTQLDIECAFVTQDQIMKLVEEISVKILDSHFTSLSFLNSDIPRISYEDSMNRYGCDKPDLRYDLRMVDITNIFGSSGCAIFDDAVNWWWVVKAYKIPATLTKKQIENLTDLAISKWLWWLAYLILRDDDTQWPLAKYLGKTLVAKLYETMDVEDWEMIFFAAAKIEVVHDALLAVKNALGDIFNHYKSNCMAFCWIIDVPMFESDGLGWRTFSHNPFSSPAFEDTQKHISWEDIGTIKSQQYDLVLNGVEIWGWSIRTHDPKVLHKTYEIMWYTLEKTGKAIWTMLEAMRYGCPPHGWFAFGLDRLLMILLQRDSIRDVMAFPKSWWGEDLMYRGPRQYNERQLKELGIRVR